MKTILLLPCLLCFVMQGFSQQYYNQTKEEMAQSISKYQESAEFNKKNKIKKSTTYNYKIKKGKCTDVKRKKNETSYNQDGFFTEYIMYSNGGKTKMKNKYLIEKGMFKEITGYKRNGSVHWKSANTFDPKGNIIENKYYWKSEEPTRTTKNRFDNFDNIIEQNVYLKKDKTPHLKYVYTYYEDKSKKQTLQYNKKGKVKHVWNFDCKPISEAPVTASKEESQICVKYETDAAGNQVKVKESIGTEKKIHRRVSRYNSKENLVEEHLYNKKNKLIYHSEFTYNENGKMTEYKFFSKSEPKPNYTVKYMYNDSGLITGYEGYDKNGKLYDIEKFEYELY